MDDAERFRLLGKYRTPRFRLGRVVMCEVRGEVVITGMTDARIPWPLGLPGRGRHSLIVYKDLAKAIRRESNQAVAHWWGVDPQTVSKWRRILSVQRVTEGTGRLLKTISRRSATTCAPRACSRPAIPSGERRSRRRIEGSLVLLMSAKPWQPRTSARPTAKRPGADRAETHRERGTLVPGTKVPGRRKRMRWCGRCPWRKWPGGRGEACRRVYARRSRLQVPDGRRRER